MVSEGKGRIFRRKDGKYLLYLPLNFCTDSQFPFEEVQKEPHSIRVKVKFVPGQKRLIVEPVE